MESDFQHIINTLLLNSVAPSTASTYKRGLLVFREFRNAFNLPDIWPIPLYHLCNFIAYLFQHHFSHSSISCYLSGISFYCKINQFEDTCQKFVVRKMLEGIKRTRIRTKDNRLPITRDLLSLIIKFLSFACNSQYEVLLFKAVFFLWHIMDF